LKIRRGRLSGRLFLLRHFQYLNGQQEFRAKASEARPAEVDISAMAARNIACQSKTKK